MEKVLGKKINIRKCRILAAVILTITIISGYLAPLEGVFAADSKYWETEYYMEVDGGIPIGDEDGIQYLYVEKGESVNFHMILTEKSNAGSGRFKETFSITMPEVLYDQAVEALKDGWLESEDTECDYLLEISDNTGTATDSNATSSNATSSNSSAEKNVQEEEGMKKLTFRFVQELRNEKKLNISVENAEGLMSFTAPVDGRITITQDGNDCRIEVQPLSIMRQDIGNGSIADGDISIVQYDSKYKVSIGGIVINEYGYTTPYQITGESSTNIVTVTTDNSYDSGEEVNIILRNASISNNTESPFQILDSSVVELTISGTNKLECSSSTAGGNCAGLYVSPNAEITIDAATDDATDSLTATGGDYGAGIGGGWNGAGGEITISGGTIEAQGGTEGAGIGGGWSGAGGEITISGGTIEAQGGTDGAGIGGGWTGAGGEITISGGTIEAQGGHAGAGIGGSLTGAGGEITISGGTIEAQGGNFGAGIGGGWNGAGGEITISGGTITAQGSDYGAGIGGGWSGAGGEIIISGGTITATKGYNSPNDIGYGGYRSAPDSNDYITILGGSICPASGADAVSPQPTNGSDDVYLNTLTVGSFVNANTAITAGSVDGNAMKQYAEPENGAYGINDVYTDENGKVYFWLPRTGNSGNEDGTVSVTAGKDYMNTWARAGNSETKTLVTVLDAPSSLAVVSDDQKVVLDWITPDDGGSSIIKYQYSASTGEDNWQDMPGSDASTTSYTVTGLSNGVRYILKVRAVNDAGEGAAASTTAIPQTTASAPVNLSATPGNNQAALRWETPDNGGSAITKYQYSIDEDNWLDIPESNETTTNYIVSGLINGNQYTVKVRAVNAIGAGEEAVVTVTPQETALVPAAPGNLTTVSGIHQIELNWTTPDDGGSAIVKYQYSTDGDNWQDIPDSDATTTSYTLTGLSSGTRYTLKIRAVNAVGVGAAATVTASTTSGSSGSGSSSSDSSSSDSSGQWKLDEKGWWYRYDNGTWPANGWVYLYYNGLFYAWYHFDADGYINTGWFTDTDGNRYYLNPVSDGSKGAMKTGWVLIDGQWYYFNGNTNGPKGALLTSTTTPDGYLVDENGAWNQEVE